MRRENEPESCGTFELEELFRQWKMALMVACAFIAILSIH
jgi:hypothetical protein